MEKIEKLEKIKDVLSKLENKEFRIFIYVPLLPENIYSMAVEELHRICFFLKNAGYDAALIVEDTEEAPYKIPEYLPEELKELPQLSPKKHQIGITPNDFIIVPEFFVNVMHQINESKLPCERIVLCQSASYMLDSLPPSTNWSMWGFRNVLTTSPELKNFINTNSRNIFDIQDYQIGIPDYFKTSKIKKPVIVYFSRYETEIKRLSKMFFLKYPELAWVMFERISGEEVYLTRERFAEKLSQTPFLLWLDKDAGFGTLPLEAMKSGAVVVGLIPELEKDFIKQDNTAVWSSSLEVLAEQLGLAVKEWLCDNVPAEVYDNMVKISNKYTVENHKQSFLTAFSHFVDEKMNKLKLSYTKIENE